MDLSHAYRPLYRFYGRRKGKPLTALRKDILAAYAPVYQLDLETMHEAIDAKDTNWLEIGFGNGEFLAETCRNRPDIHLIGCEPFMNGVAALLTGLHVAQDQNAPYSNLSLWHDDARPLIDALPDHSIDRVYLLNPDPWPKTRHHNRRFIQPERLDTLARIMKPGGRLIMSTDHADLATWMAAHANGHAAFADTGETGAHKTTPPADWPINQTRYMKKGLAGKTIYWLIYERHRDIQ